MKANWRQIPLGEVISQRKEFIEINDLEKYKRCRVKLHAQGIVLRDEVSGMEIKTKRQQVCRAGEFLVAEIDAKVGGYGIVPESLNNSIVSSHYFLFEINEPILNRNFLDYFTRTRNFSEQISAQGSTNYAAIRPKEVLSYQIPLPPIEEQRRIVARIDELADKIKEARGLRRELNEVVNSLILRTLSENLSSEKWEMKHLESLLAEPPRNGLSPQQEVDEGSISMLRINAVSSSPSRFVDVSAYKSVDVSDNVAEQFLLKRNDVFIVRYNGDINRVAKAAIFKGDESKKVVYPDKLMRLRANTSQMLPDFLVYALSSFSVRNQVEKLGKTTAGQIGVSGKDAKSFIIPTPPIEEQKQIVAYLDGLQAKTEAVKKLQAETQAELDALLPSILDKAFKGEL